MYDPNTILDRLLSESRRLGGGARLVIRRWLKKVEEHAVLQELIDDRSVPVDQWRRAHRRLRRAERLARGGPACYRIDNRIRGLAIGWEMRGVPLHARGARPDPASRSLEWLEMNHPRVGKRRSFTGPPVSARAAIHHFCAVTGMEQMEAEDFCERLALNYHRSVRNLVRVKFAACPFFYGRARRFMLREHGMRDGGGVWISHVSKPGKDGERTATVVFEHCGGKQRFTVDVPVTCDPNEIDLRPPNPFASGIQEPEGLEDELQAVAECLGLSVADVRHRLVGLAHSLWRIHSEASAPIPHWRVGHYVEGEWSRRKARWTQNSVIAGVWVDELDTSRLTMTLCLEPEPGRVTKLDVPTPALVDDDERLMGGSMEPDSIMPNAFRLLDTDGRRFGYGMLGRTPAGRKWFSSETLVGLSRAKRDFIQAEAA